VRNVKSPAATADGADVALPDRARVDELLPLARAAVAGDSEAAATLVAHVGRSILSVVRRVLGRDCPDVEDVAQDAAMAFLARLETFRGECSVLHFCQRIALLTALSAERRRRLREHWTPPADPQQEAVDARSSPLDGTLARKRHAILRDLMAELPEVIAESLGMHYVLGYTVEEIAGMAGVSPNTVWSRLRLGKGALRRKLDGDHRLAELLEVPR
jgi:RNA polymerase sigma factor (sigma-70 family)